MMGTLPALSQQERSSNWLKSPGDILERSAADAVRHIRRDGLSFSSPNKIRSSPSGNQTKVKNRVPKHDGFQIEGDIP